MKKAFIFSTTLLLFVLTSFNTSAQNVDVQSFKTNPFLFVDDTTTGFSGDVSKKGTFVLGLLFDYQRAPLTIWTKNPWKLDSYVIKDQLSSDIVAGYSFFNWFDVGVVMPVVLYQSGDGFPGESNPATFGIGDMRLTPRFRLYKRADKKLSISAVGVFTLPTGHLVDSYMGAQNVTFSPTLALSSTWNKFSFTGNLYYKVAENSKISSLKLNDEIGFNLGAIYRVLPKKLDVIAELYGRTLAAEPFADRTQAPLELTAAVRYRLTNNITLVGGAGAGLSKGYATPDFRVFTGIAFVKRGNEDPDNDHILGSKDQCPNEPEDYDNYKDSDGCPDPDNDGDGVPDIKDKAPGTDKDISDNFINTKEDKDGYKDSDGVPDPDNDGDSIPDVKDKCPGTDKDVSNNFKNVKELFNKINDDDGCPEKDADNDGIIDEQDSCPNKPEDKDNFRDNDGCPDPDNDGDGIPDVKDKAPGTNKDIKNNFKYTKEDKDGFKDDDGVPDFDNDNDKIPDVKDKCPGTDKDIKNNFKKTKENINGVKDTDGCPDKGKTLVKVSVKKIVILQKVFFAFNRSKIKRRSYNLLRQVASILKLYKNINKVEIQGHTDTLGRHKHNMKLSQKRAKAVKKFLVKRGVEASRLIAKGYGPDKPMKDCSSIKKRRARKKCEAVNRRVEFIILKK